MENNLGRLGCSIGLFALTKKIIFYTNPEEPYILWDGQYERPYWEPRPDFRKDLDSAKQAEISTIELGIDGAWLKSTALDHAKYAFKQVKKAGLRASSVHMPFATSHINLSAVDEEERMGTIKYVKELFKIINKFDVDTVVFHPGGNSKDDPQKCMQSLINSVKELKNETDAKICIENMVRSTFFERADQVKNFLDAVDGGYTCVDVNHFLHDNPEDAILLYGNKIGAVHISDNHRDDEEHRMPGEGLINWDKVVNAFNKVNYKGQINYELSMSKFGYSYQDITDNYQKIFKNINK